MKKLFLALCLTAALLLSGCAADDTSKMAKLTDPAGNGSVVVGQAPSAGWPAEDMAKNIYAKQTSTKYTDHLEWHLDGDFFTSEEFCFVIPTKWRNHFELRISTQIKEVSRQFSFYFIEYETGIEVEVMRMIAIKTGTRTDINRMGGKILGYSEDGAYAYLLMPITTFRPGDSFQSGQTLHEILTTIHSEGFEIQIVA